MYTCIQLEKEMATHFSSLAWRIPWTEESDGLQSIVSRRVGHNWATITYTIEYYSAIRTGPCCHFFITCMDLRALCYVKLVRQRKILFYSVQFSHSVISDSLRPHGLQHTRLPCPALTPRVCSNSCPLSWWCHPTISSSIIPFSSCLQSFPVSGSFPMSQFFTSDGQIIGVSALASVLPMNIQDWPPLGWIGWIFLQSKGLSRVFSSTTVQKH